MTSLSPQIFSVIQGALIITIAPIATGIFGTLSSLITKKTWKHPRAPYRRSSSWLSIAMVVVAIILAMLLPLFGTIGILAEQGSIGVLIALLGVFAGLIFFINPHDASARIVLIYIAIFLALGIGVGSANMNDVAIGTLGDYRLQFIFAGVAFFMGLLAARLHALKAGVASIAQDGSMILWATMSVLFIRLYVPGIPFLIDGSASWSQLGFVVLYLLLGMFVLTIILDLFAVLLFRFVPHVSPKLLLRPSLILIVFSLLSSIWTQG